MIFFEFLTIKLSPESRTGDDRVTQSPQIAKILK